MALAGIHDKMSMRLRNASERNAIRLPSAPISSSSADSASSGEKMSARQLSRVTDMHYNGRPSLMRSSKCMMTNNVASRHEDDFLARSSMKWRLIGKCSIISLFKAILAIAK